MSRVHTITEEDINAAMGPRVEPKADSGAPPGEHEHAKTTAPLSLVGGDIDPQDTQELTRVARLALAGGSLPRDMTLPQAMMLILTGRAIGLTPAQSVAWIMWIPRQNRFALWGDIQLSLVLRSGKIEDHGYEFVGSRERREDGSMDPGYGCRFWAKRVGMPTTQDWVYSVEDANTAGLLARNTQSAWSTHPRRMLFVRARAFVLRNTFADVLGGMYSVEELIEVTHAERSNQRIEEEESRLGRLLRTADTTTTTTTSKETP